MNPYCTHCCAKDNFTVNTETKEVFCHGCNTSTPIDEWNLVGWRDIFDYPPTHSGPIVAWGPECGRVTASWGSVSNKLKVHDDNYSAADVTHWLRVPKPIWQKGTSTAVSLRHVHKLYNPTMPGYIVLPSRVDETFREWLTKHLSENKDIFEVKREKYIENNQLVHLLYRGPFADSMAQIPKPFQPVLSHYLKLRENFERHSQIPFAQGSSIEIKMIHYPVSKLGVGTHRDLSSNVNMVVFYNIEGEGILNIHDTKDDEATNEYVVLAGDVSIMRAPRSNEPFDIRPYHSIGEVHEPRTVLVIREIDEVLEAEVNQNNWRGF